MFTGINVLSQTYFLKNSDVTIQKRNDNKIVLQENCVKSLKLSHIYDCLIRTFIGLLGTFRFWDGDENEYEI